jgi:hypothetical protein
LAEPTTPVKAKARAKAKTTTEPKEVTKASETVTKYTFNREDY